MNPRAALSRRTALAAAALVPVGLAACDIDPPPDPAPSRGPTPTPDADSALVASLVTAITAAEAVVAAASGAVPTLAPTLDALAAAHAEHRELLERALPETPAEATPDGGVPANRSAALAAVRRVERRLRTRVERASGRAASGNLARVLAVMAGSLAQHAAALDAAAGTRTVR